MITYQEKYKIYKKAKKIVESNLSWDEKYDLIFSKEISQQFDFDWYDPDRYFMDKFCDYQDDVMAFMDALSEHMKINEDDIYF